MVMVEIFGKKLHFLKISDNTSSTIFAALLCTDPILPIAMNAGTNIGVIAADHLSRTTLPVYIVNLLNQLLTSVQQTIEP